MTAVVWCALVVLEIERASLRVALVQLVLAIAYTVWRYSRASLGTARRDVAGSAELPAVTIQLPMKDERHVAARAIATAAAIDYPRDRLDIQVLDDSTDDTSAIVDRAVEAARATGVEIQALRSTDRACWKATALARGMAAARGELCAVFDADAVPPRDFLLRTVGAFADPRVGMVQGRCGFLAARRAPLVAAQTAMLNYLMGVAQPSSSADGRPFQFNGTAGVWRRACIDDAGGWRGGYATEDLDLSCRALMRGWRFVHDPRVVVATELPATMAAFRNQQRRWTRGNAEIAKAHTGAILRSSLPWRHRAALLIHVWRRAFYVLLAVLAVTMPLTTFGTIHTLVDYTLVQDAVVFGGVVAALAIGYAVASRATGEPWWRSPFAALVVVMLHIGLAPACATSFVTGLFRPMAGFERTPKRGDDATSSYRARFDLMCVVELAAAAAYVGFAHRALSYGYTPIALFFALFAVSFAWVGAASLRR
jgi:cellulose synthase/poly-beta-1,6-N-acetylglucosamine synthase-like glycosyltransferase